MQLSGHGAGVEVTPEDWSSEHPPVGVEREQCYLICMAHLPRARPCSSKSRFLSLALSLFIFQPSRVIPILQTKTQRLVKVMGWQVAGPGLEPLAATLQELLLNVARARPGLWDQQVQHAPPPLKYY